jgi:uncharacterized protein YkwD
LMRTAVLALLAFAFLCGGARAADDPYAALLAPTGTCGAAADASNLDQKAAQTVMVCLTNFARTASGLAPLVLNDTLSAAGAAKLSADVSCGVFSHEPCGQPFQAVFATYTNGASSYQIGENIAWGTGSSGTARSIMAAWLHSSGHRENILAPAFKEIGIGYLPDETFQGYAGAALWSQEFGVRTPQPAPAAKASAAKPQTTSKTRTKKSPKRQARRLRHS